MADFCNNCAKEMFGEEVAPEIDVFQIFSSLEPGYIQSGYLCEGCGLIAVAKTDDGELKVLRINEENESNTELEDY